MKSPRKPTRGKMRPRKRPSSRPSAPPPWALPIVAVMKRLEQVFEKLVDGPVVAAPPAPADVVPTATLRRVNEPLPPVPAGAVRIRGTVISDYGAPTKDNPGGVFFQADTSENAAVIPGKELLHLARDADGIGATVTVSLAFAETHGLVAT